MGVTQKQIAERLNVSRSLVARALKLDPGIPESTQQRVAAMAREMGYDAGSNPMARALIGQRYGHRVQRNTIAVVYCTNDVIAVSALPFHMPILEGIDRAADALGMDVCVCSSRGDRLPNIVRERNVDGVISMGLYPKHVIALGHLGHPEVTLGWERDLAHSAMTDDREGMRLVTRHLLEQGHRRIAFLGVSFMGVHGETILDSKGRVLQLPSARRRIEGYLDAMAEFGVTVPDSWMQTRLPLPDASTARPCDVQCGRCAACIGWETLMAANGGVDGGGHWPFTAMVCHNDPIAMGVIEQARAAGVSVPQELSVTGFDDLSGRYGFMPEITTVRYSGQEVGRSAVQLLHAAIQHEYAGGQAAANEEPGFQHAVIPVELALHDSTCPPMRAESAVSPSLGQEQP